MHKGSRANLQILEADGSTGGPEADAIRRPSTDALIVTCNVRRTQRLLDRSLIAIEKAPIANKKMSCARYALSSLSILRRGETFPQTVAIYAAGLGFLYLKPPSGPPMCSIGKRSSNSRGASIPIPLFVR